MKKMLAFIGAALLWVVGVQAQQQQQVYPVSFLSGTPLTSGWATCITDENQISLEIGDMQEGAFVMELFLRSPGEVTYVGAISDDIVDEPTITSGVFHTLDGDWNWKVVFTISNRLVGRLTSGKVIFASTVPWSADLGAHIMLVKVNATGPTGEGSCWLVAVKPPTPTEVASFNVSEIATTNVVIIRKIINGRLTPTGTNITVTVKAGYQFVIGSSDASSICVWGERLTGTGQSEFFSVGSLVAVSPGMQYLQTPVTIPNTRNGKYFLMAYTLDGASEVVAAVDLNAPPPL